MHNIWRFAVRAVYLQWNCIGDSMMNFVFYPFVLRTAVCEHMLIVGYLYILID